jgi:hypothetical protein
MSMGPEFDRLMKPHVNPETGPGMRPLATPLTPQQTAHLGNLAIQGAQQPPPQK